ncbi:MAG: RsmB/NOP family class I SAM-dependent RNA methyltransferase [Myxococcaceae bacterium]
MILHPSSSTDRLRTIPWAALEGLGPALAPAIDEVLLGRPAERVLDRLLRRAKLEADQRRAAAEAVFGVGLWRRRLGAPAPALVLLARLARDLGGFADAERVLGIVASAAPEPHTLADRYSMPDWLAAEVESVTGAEAEAAADAFNLPAPIFLRARGPRDELAESLREDGIETRPCAHASAGLEVVSERPNLYGSSAWQDALFEVQDESSQRVGELTHARPGMRVLDLCAGAGGKTVHLAELMKGQGELHAYDVDSERLGRLRQRAERAQVRGLRIHQPGQLPDGPFDVVLVDAPCSELGALRRGPDLRWRLDPADFTKWPLLQRELLATAIERVGPGGRLVYATCTFRREENEEVASTVSWKREATLTLWPHRDRSDGFFAAAWTRP